MECVSYMYPLYVSIVQILQCFGKFLYLLPSFYQILECLSNYNRDSLDSSVRLRQCNAVETRHNMDPTNIWKTNEKPFVHVGFVCKRKNHYLMSKLFKKYCRQTGSDFLKKLFVFTFFFDHFWMRCAYWIHLWSMHRSFCNNVITFT